jgi:DNA-binding protein H-NS
LEKQMSKLEQLLKQQQEIAAAIEAEKTKGRQEVLATVRGLCKQYGITLREVKSYVLERKPRVGKDGVAVVKPRVARKAAAGVKRGRPAKK